jgi:hypothetical protein
MSQEITEAWLHGNQFRSRHPVVGGARFLLVQSLRNSLKLLLQVSKHIHHSRIVDILCQGGLLMTATTFFTRRIFFAGEALFAARRADVRLLFFLPPPSSSPFLRDTS